MLIFSGGHREELRVSLGGLRGEPRGLGDRGRAVVSEHGGVHDSCPGHSGGSEHIGL